MLTTIFPTLTDPLVTKLIGFIFLVLILYGLGLVIASIILVKRKMREEMKALWTKYLSWFIIAPALLVPLMMGRFWFISVIMLISFLCFREFTLAVGLWRDRWFCNLGYLTIFVIFLAVYFDNYALFTSTPFFGALAVLSVPILRGEFEKMIQKTSLTIEGFLYLGWFFAHIAYLTNMLYGMSHALFLILMVELNDVAAFTGGKLFGRHKLEPKISPKKTWEGTIFSIVAMVLLAFVFRFALPEFASWQILLIGVVISIGGTFGDLTISFIKRDLHIKDMGKLIPGHGGILDRFDSLIFVSPIFFHLTRFFFISLFFHQ